jgi:hypothetical protein
MNRWFYSPIPTNGYLIFEMIFSSINLLPKMHKITYLISVYK